MAKTTIIPKQTCLACHRSLSGACAPFEPSKDASPGDIAMCDKCGHVMRLDDNLRVRALTPDEAAGLLRNERLMKQIGRTKSEMIRQQAEMN